ncbi:LuxR C-terminal-related transcriptional regulator [Pontibacter akesuensis]|uniref:PAS fold-containing protein n=1 Tax=Pontibacter akesuensis TaxID=388950 RepID=A0A1I7FU17_9BACT|nr:LuxR C-terminal-related transcriptional regulator [Pontibacter akesuensis]GHA60500.1 helix-turn-helix transcriptional regulator [Pontibacter akesuensis]SFU39663.1 PAS fold-containing protein [Pontibacter akesuensis]
MPDPKILLPADEQVRELERKLAELEEKCAFLERVVHELPANIYISDLEKGVVWCNRTNEESLGYTLEEIKEMGGLEYMYKIVHPDDHTIPDNSIDHYKNFNGTEYGGVFRAKHRDEQEYKWFIGWARAFGKNKEGEVKELLCVDVDMSPQMNTEEQLVQALRENLKNKNRLLLQSLRKREVEVLQLICKGMRTKAIAEKLFISVNTVSTHRKNIQHKLGTANVAELVSLANEAGLI